MQERAAITIDRPRANILGKSKVDNWNDLSPSTVQRDEQMPIRPIHFDHVKSTIDNWNDQVEKETLQTVFLIKGLMLYLGGGCDKVAWFLHGPSTRGTGEIKLQALIN